MITSGEYKKFDIWMADLSLAVGAEQSGHKPCMIISNNIGNKFAPVVTVAVITSKVKTEIPTHVYLNAELNGLLKDSTLLLEQVRTIDKNRLMRNISTAHSSIRKQINDTIQLSFDTEDQMAYVERNNTFSFA